MTYIPSSPSNPASSSKRTKASPKASLKAGLARATNGNGTLRSRAGEGVHQDRRRPE